MKLLCYEKNGQKLNFVFLFVTIFSIILIGEFYEKRDIRKNC